jgi:hypothetical protein
MIQIIKRKCCGKIFAACCEPSCYTDNDWLKDLKKYVNRGDKVEMIPDNSGLKFEKCICNDITKIVAPNLFSELSNSR